MGNKIRGWLDQPGDTWLGLFTSLVLIRIALVLKGFPALTMSEATAYSTCVAAFSYSKGHKCD